MSLLLKYLNLQLRYLEKPALAKSDPARLRKSFAFKSKLYFHAPRGSRFSRDTQGGVPVQWVHGRGAGGKRILLYLHGGGYVFGSSDTHRAMLAYLSRLTGLPACLPDYRLAPEHPFPAQIDDALACYKALSAEYEIVLGGDSAGGGLALGLLAEILRQGLPAPRGVFAFSPLADMTFTNPSVSENADSDNVLTADRVGELVDRVLAGQAADDPRISPVFGRFEGAPPVWLAVGDTEILRDDSQRMAQVLTDQGVDCALCVEHDFPHVWTLFHNILPEARATLAALAGWIAKLD